MIPTLSASLTRRAGLVAAGGALLTLAGCNDSAKTPEPPKAAGGAPGTEASVDVTELMKPGDLPDQALGKADAPVTVVEYASMTCSHCATFHNETMDHLKKTYIDTGKVRYHLPRVPARSRGLCRLAAGALRRRGQVLPDAGTAVQAAARLGLLRKAGRGAARPCAAGGLHPGELQRLPSGSEQLRQDAEGSASAPRPHSMSIRRPPSSSTARSSAAR
jgi:hypothetical protein